MLIVIAVLYAVLLFVCQMILFRKTPRRIHHMIPLIVIGGVYLAALLLPAADGIMAALGRNDGYSFYAFAAWITAGINTLGLAANGIAWLIEKV